jgi:hypothetical protein
LEQLVCPAAAAAAAAAVAAAAALATTAMTQMYRTVFMHGFCSCLSNAAHNSPACYLLCLLVLAVAVAPAGSYLDNAVGKKCQKGTFSTDFNLNAACESCPDGITTAGDGSTSPAACALAEKGFYINRANTSEAVECPLDAFQDQEANVTACTPCPNGYKTQETGATGNASCSAPPGFELKEGADNITACTAGSYKEGWNRSPCVVVSGLAG